MIRSSDKVSVTPRPRAFPPSHSSHSSPVSCVPSVPLAPPWSTLSQSCVRPASPLHQSSGRSSRKTKNPRCPTWPVASKRSEDGSNLNQSKNRGPHSPSPYALSGPIHFPHPTASAIKPPANRMPASSQTNRQTQMQTKNPNKQALANPIKPEKFFRARRPVRQSFNGGGREQQPLVRRTASQPPGCNLPQKTSTRLPNPNSAIFQGLSLRSHDKTGPGPICLPSGACRPTII